MTADTIWLAWPVWERAADCGIRRVRAEGFDRGRPPADYGQRILKDVYGACGEAATAQRVNRQWPASVDVYNGQPDVPGSPPIECKTRCPGARPDLPLKTEEWKGDLKPCYVLVHAWSIVCYTCVGWLLDSDLAERLDELAGPNQYGSKFVPAEWFRPMRDFPGPGAA